MTIEAVYITMQSIPGSSRQLDHRKGMQSHTADGVNPKSFRDREKSAWLNCFLWWWCKGEGKGGLGDNKE